MKRFAIMLTLMFTCLSLFSTAADARRLGGGSSFGKQRDLAQKPVQRDAQQTTNTAPAKTTPPASNGSKWLGPLAGLAIGAGLATLFSHLGMSEGMGMLMLALLAGALVLFLIARFSKARAPAMQYAGGNPASPPQRMLEPSSFGAGSADSNAAPSLAAASMADTSIPADFPTEAFLRNGKRSFIRLQAANDRKDLDDIREYTTPEMFAEIAMQLSERDASPQKTDVVALDAQLLEVNEEGDYAIASVHFRAQLRENNGPVEQVSEVWHVQKHLRDDNASWLLAGIQQMN